jgi:hypothetical protein
MSPERVRERTVRDEVRELGKRVWEPSELQKLMLVLHALAYRRGQG